MTKIESLDKLERLGFNVPRRLLSIQGSTSKNKKIDTWCDWRDCIRKIKMKKISIRTELLGSFKTPHFPNVSITRADKEMKDLLDKDYSIYIFEPIDPNDCLYK